MTRPILPLASGLAAAISLTAGLGVANGQTSYQSAVLADNPISYWSLDETTGTTAADQQGLNPGAFVELGSNLQLGQPGATIGGSSILCNGGFVTIPDDDSLDLTETFTIEMWIRPDVTTTPGYILDKDFDEYCVLIGFQSGKVNALMGTNYYGPSAMPITAGNWYHLVYTKNVNFVGDNWRGYLNGVEFFSSYNNFTLPTNTGNLNLGTSRGFADYFGLLDEVAIYDYALSSAQVANHHASATAPVDTDGDGLSDDDEVNVYGTDPNDADSDDDGLNDGDEIGAGTDPNNVDSDGDGDPDGSDPNPLTFDDADADGLSDYMEVNTFGTDPNVADTDGDGLLDGTEVDPATGTDPLDADSDDDGLSDGDEVNDVGSNPNDADSDDDGVGDAADPLPNDPGVTSGYIEDALRAQGALACAYPLSEIDAKNNNARKGRRNAICNKLNAAANAMAAGDHQDAVDQLTSLLQKVDDDPNPRDWMVSGALKTAVRNELVLQITLIELL